MLKFRSRFEAEAWSRFAAAVVAGWWACDAGQLPDDRGLIEEASDTADCLALKMRERMPQEEANDVGDGPK